MAVCYSGDLRRRRRGPRADPRARRPGRRPARGAAVHRSCSPTSTRPSRRATHYYWKTEYVAELTDELLSTAARARSPSARSRRREIGFLHLGGALNERAATTARSATATPGSSSASNGMWEPDEPSADEFRQWIREAWERCGRSRPAATTSTSRRPTRARSASARPTAPTSSVSSRSSSRYDPDNLFRVEPQHQARYASRFR